MGCPEHISPVDAVLGKKNAMQEQENYVAVDRCAAQKHEGLQLKNVHILYII
jgi:hypothetical protein